MLRELVIMSAKCSCRSFDSSISYTY